jgi:hypothetical protein
MDEHIQINRNSNLRSLYELEPNHVKNKSCLCFAIQKKEKREPKNNRYEGIRVSQTKALYLVR